MLISLSRRGIQQLALRSHLSLVQVRASSANLATVKRLPPQPTVTFALNMEDAGNQDDQELLDIEELHQEALRNGKSSYTDPTTGFTVFSELLHLKRGKCCGNECRHCPYGYANVPGKEGTGPPAKAVSGDKEGTRAMVHEILANAKKKGKSPELAAGEKPSKNIPYTRKGDKGTSQLLTGERRSKSDDNFEAIGTVDELCSIVGVCLAHLDVADDYGDLPNWLLDVMSRLFDVGSHLAKPRAPGTTEYKPDGIGGGFHAKNVDDLELWINQMTEELPEITSFILPAGGKAASHLHVARTVCRRAERRTVPLATEELTCDPNALRYLNRLSDFFFVAARWANSCEGLREIEYRRDASERKQRKRVLQKLEKKEDK